jgi:Tat protein translocase TatB subunit
MFGIGFPELIVILVVALIVLGPKRLPEAARTIGKAVAEFRRQTSQMMDEFNVRGIMDDEPTRPSTRPAPPVAAAPKPPRPPDEPDASA